MTCIYRTNKRIYLESCIPMVFVFMVFICTNKDLQKDLILDIFGQFQGAIIKREY